MKTSWRVFLPLAILAITSACSQDSDVPREASTQQAAPGELDAHTGLPPTPPPPWLVDRPEHAKEYKDETILRLRLLLDRGGWQDGIWNAQGTLEIVHSKTGLPFVLVPAGSFQMGSGLIRVNLMQPDPFPVHNVTVGPYLLGKHECTQYAWTKGGGKNNSSQRGEDNPIENLSWHAAFTWCCATNGLRLPSESEWEYACRAGSTGKWCFGDDESLLGAYAKYRGNSNGQTTSVGGKKPNAWGLLDMHGGVEEWCRDGKYGYYDDDTHRDGSPYLTWSTDYICRGGSSHSQPVECRSAYRWGHPAVYQASNCGLRPAAHLPVLAGEEAPAAAMQSFSTSKYYTSTMSLLATGGFKTLAQQCAAWKREQPEHPVPDFLLSCIYYLGEDFVQMNAYRERAFESAHSTTVIARWIETSVQKYSSSAWIHCAQGNLLLFESRYGLALQSYTRAVVLEPNDPRLRYHKGVPISLARQHNLYRSRPRMRIQPTGRAHPLEGAWGYGFMPIQDEFSVNGQVESKPIPNVPGDFSADFDEPEFIGNVTDWVYLFDRPDGKVIGWAVVATSGSILTDTGPGYRRMESRNLRYVWEESCPVYPFDYLGKFVLLNPQPERGKRLVIPVELYSTESPRVSHFIDLKANGRTDVFRLSPNTRLPTNINVESVGKWNLDVDIFCTNNKGAATGIFTDRTGRKFVFNPQNMTLEFRNRGKGSYIEKACIW